MVILCALIKNETHFLQKVKEDPLQKMKDLDVDTLVLCYGSKLAHTITTLRKLWAEKEDAKVIIFSKVS